MHGFEIVNKASEGTSKKSHKTTVKEVEDEGNVPYVHRHNSASEDEDGKEEEEEGSEEELGA